MFGIRKRLKKRLTGKEEEDYSPLDVIFHPWEYREFLALVAVGSPILAIVLVIDAAEKLYNPGW